MPESDGFAHHANAESGRAPSLAIPRPEHLRILTQSLILEPIGGIELCTYEDSGALVRRGHSLNVMFGIDGPMRQAYESVGVAVSGPYTFGLKTIRELAGYGPAAAAARRWRPDVLWLNRPEHIIWGQAVSRWSRTPIVCHLHHLPNFRWTRPLSVGVRHFVAVSEFMRDSWIDAGIDADRISVIYNAISPDDYPVGGKAEQRVARQELGLPQGVPIVLYYGRMVVEKGLITLLKAWLELGFAASQALLVLAGGSSPDEDPDVKEALNKLPPGSYQWLPGRADVTPLLHASDLVVFPSWVAEAFGRVVIEAMSTGRPVIASQVGAVSEILTDTMSRFLVPPRDAEKLGSRIKSMLTWREIEPELAQQCADWVQERFPYNRHVDNLEKVLLEHSSGWNEQ